MCVTVSIICSRPIEFHLPELYNLRVAQQLYSTGDAREYRTIVYTTLRAMINIQLFSVLSPSLLLGYVPRIENPPRAVPTSPCRHWACIDVRFRVGIRNSIHCFCHLFSLVSFLTLYNIITPRRFPLEINGF